MNRGISRLLGDLLAAGYAVEEAKDSNEQLYAVIRGYEVELGRFAGRVVDLGLPAPENFPEAFGSSIHIRCIPQLLEKTDSVQNVRNITDSALGPDWRYWSHNFGGSGERSTRRLLSQVNEIFLHV